MQPVLYWAPERRGSLWARAWDLVWASPLTDALLALFGASRRGRLAELAGRVAPYLPAARSRAPRSRTARGWCARSSARRRTRASPTTSRRRSSSTSARVGAFAAWCAGARARRARGGDEAGLSSLLSQVRRHARARARARRRRRGDGRPAHGCASNRCARPRTRASSTRRASRRSADCDIRVARLGLAAPAQRGAALDPRLEDVPSCSTTRPQDKHAANIGRCSRAPRTSSVLRRVPAAAVRGDPPRAVGARRAARGIELAVAYLALVARAGRARLGARAFAATRTAAPDRIDVLKVDVEGLELAVLESIEDEWWPRVRRVIVEVHDLGARCDKVLALLRAKGFAAQKLSDDYYNDEIGMNHHMIVAHRGEPQQTAAERPPVRRRGALSP